MRARSRASASSVGAVGGGPALAVRSADSYPGLGWHERLVSQSDHHCIMPRFIGGRDAGEERGGLTRGPVGILDSDRIARQEFDEVCRTDHDEKLVKVRPDDVVNGPCDQRLPAKWSHQLWPLADESG